MRPRTSMIPTSPSGTLSYGGIGEPLEVSLAWLGCGRRQPGPGTQVLNHQVAQPLLGKCSDSLPRGPAVTPGPERNWTGAWQLPAWPMHPRMWAGAVRERWPRLTHEHGSEQAFARLLLYARLGMAPRTRIRMPLPLVPKCSEVSKRLKAGDT